jgi:hypothetical protein
MFEMLQDELGPLSVAGSLAYFDLNRVKGEAGSDEHLRDVVDLAVVALAYVAPIHLDCLYIRRSDLEAAVRNLQKCTEHGPFRRP